jgi:hypothetical protein
MFMHACFQVDSHALHTNIISWHVYCLFFFCVFVRSLRSIGISGLVQDAGLEEEVDEEEGSNENQDFSKYDDEAEGNTVAASSPERRPPSNSSPSHTIAMSERVQL